MRRRFVDGQRTPYLGPERLSGEAPAEARSEGRSSLLQLLPPPFSKRACPVRIWICGQPAPPCRRSLFCRQQRLLPNDLIPFCAVLPPVVLPSDDGWQFFLFVLQFLSCVWFSLDAGASLQHRVDCGRASPSPSRLSKSNDRSPRNRPGFRYAQVSADWRFARATIAVREKDTEQAPSQMCFSVFFVCGAFFCACGSS